MMFSRKHTASISNNHTVYTLGTWIFVGVRFFYVVIYEKEWSQWAILKAIFG